jgi:hypothetical protein|tara:strand:- start:10181 stop:10381 length:201 start_codon:yes stop_codon:yes gene_type:complete
MKYKNIKSILRGQIKANSRTLWTWKKGVNEEFIMIYKDYGDDLPIYTPVQLLDLLTQTEKLTSKNK